MIITGLLFSLLACDKKNASASFVENTNAMRSSVETAFQKLESIDVIELGYKNLVSFDEGKVVSTNTADPVNLPVTLVMLYKKSAEWADDFNKGKFETTNSEALNSLMKEHQLRVQRVFSLDSEHDGAVLEPVGTLADPVETTKALSLLEYVIMVHLKQVPASAVN